MSELNWDAFAPLKVKIFLWVMRHGRTQKCATLHGAVDTSNCLLCVAVEEDIHHHLVACALGRLCSWLQPFWASLLRQWCNRVWIYYPDLDTVNWDLNSISIFEYKDDLKWEKFELQNCRSRRKLQFAYKFYPHPSSYQKKLWFFWREVVLAATGNYGRNPLAAAGWNGPFNKMVRGYFYKFLNLLYIFEKS